MSLGTYGLATPAPGARRFGAGLSGMADQQEADAAGLARNAAQNETNLNIGNQRANQERKAGNAQLGAVGGAQVGAMFGPWGALAGGIIGGLAGGHF